MKGACDTGTGLRTTRNGAQLRLQVGWDDLPGNTVLHQTVTFDGTPEGFDAAVDEIRVKMHESARSPMRPCGHPGPWHEVGSVVEPTEGRRASTQKAPSAKEPVADTTALRPCSPLEIARNVVSQVDVAALAESFVSEHAALVAVPIDEKRAEDRRRVLSREVDECASTRSSRVAVRSPLQAAQDASRALTTRPLYERVLLGPQVVFRAVRGALLGARIACVQSVKRAEFSPNQPASRSSEAQHERRHP